MTSSLIPLSYASPKRVGGIGAMSVAAGVWGILVNVAIGATLGRQLMKQWGYIPRGQSGQPIDAWLTVTVVESCLSALLAAVALLIGVAALRGRPGAISLHRRYAWAKLPLAVVFAACVGWGMPFFGIAEVGAVASAVVLAFLLSAGYPLLLLRTLPRV